MLKEQSYLTLHRLLVDIEEVAKYDKLVFSPGPPAYKIYRVDDLVRIDIKRKKAGAV